MFRCELKFDESKVQENGYTMDAVHQIVDKIFQKIGVPKISEGIYVDKDSDDSNLTMETTFRLLDCPVVVHFCNYADAKQVVHQFVFDVQRHRLVEVRMPDDVLPYGLGVL